MRDFLAGWRRKTGLLFLGLALVFSAGWVRSFQYRDIYTIRQNDSMITFRSFEGGIGCQHFSPAAMLASTGWRSDYHFKFSVSDPWWRFDNFDDSDIEWRHDWAGFSVGSAAKKDPPILRNLQLAIVPYWSIVTPLIAISMYLLLIKNRNSAPAPFDLNDEKSAI